MTYIDLWQEVVTTVERAAYEVLSQEGLSPCALVAEVLAAAAVLLPLDLPANLTRPAVFPEEQVRKIRSRLLEEAKRAGRDGPPLAATQDQPGYPHLPRAYGCGLSSPPLPNLAYASAVHFARLEAYSTEVIALDAQVQMGAGDPPRGLRGRGVVRGLGGVPPVANSAG